MDGLAGFSGLNYCILFVYFGVLFSIGLLLAKKQRSTEDYFLAGRNMPWLFVAMSMLASLTSAVSYMGVPGTSYAENISYIFAAPMALITAPIVIFFFFPLYRKLRITTTYDYILKRFGKEARYIASALFLLQTLGWMGTILYAPALALSVVTGINIWLAIILMGVLTTGYTVLGGLPAVIWTDVIQFLILVGGAIWVFVSLLNGVPGGFSQIIEIAGDTDHLRVFEWKLDFSRMNAIAVTIAWFFISIQAWGIGQVSVQRLLAVKTYGGVAKALIANGVFEMIMLTLLLFIGIGMFAYFHVFPERLVEGLVGDRFLPYYIIHALPNGVSGLLITAIFAAAMSSMDSAVNSSATVIVNDFVRPLSRKPRTDQQDLKLARIITIGFGFFAIVVACYVSRIEGVLKAINMIGGYFGAPATGLFFLGIFSRRANFQGWVVSTLLIAMPFQYWIQNIVDVHWIYYSTLGLFVTVITTYLLSILISALWRLPVADDQYTVWGTRFSFSDFKENQSAINE